MNDTTRLEIHGALDQLLDNYAAKYGPKDRAVLMVSVVHMDSNDKRSVVHSFDAEFACTSDGESFTLENVDDSLSDEPAAS